MEIAGRPHGSVLLRNLKQAVKDCYKKICADPAALDRLLVDVFLESQERPPKEILLDLDATDDPVRGV